MNSTQQRTRLRRFECSNTIHGRAPGPRRIWRKRSGRHHVEARNADVSSRRCRMLCHRKEHGSNLDFRHSENEAGHDVLNPSRQGSRETAPGRGRSTKTRHSGHSNSSDPRPVHDARCDEQKSGLRTIEANVSIESGQRAIGFRPMRRDRACRSWSQAPRSSH